jgi:hypothetical protein
MKRASIRVGGTLASLVCAACVIASSRPAAAPRQDDRIWFSPNPGTLDLQRMFEHPEEWWHTRSLMSVYNFTEQHTYEVPDPIVGPNSYAALARAGAFRQLTRWGKKISIGVGPVKEFYCADPDGANEALRRSLRAIDAVAAAGGVVNFLSMDEPWVSGRAKACDGLALDKTADRVTAYMTAVTRARPDVRIGLIEAYPFSNADQIESMLDLLKTRGTSPAFLHMDVDWHRSGADAFTRDMKRLAEACKARSLPFGIIITGYNGDADALFAADAYGIAHLIGDTFGSWSAMPDHIMLDSWVESRTGLRITPANLPEDRPYTQTSLLSDIYRYLRGLNATGSAQRAVPRS